MGIYLNPGADLFLEAKRDEIYVDKSALIEELNKVYGKSRKYVCVSRPRRFGKTMAANMVCAYYDRTVVDEVFDRLAIAQAEDFSRYRGACDVLRINMQEFLSRAQDMAGLLSRLRRIVLRDLLRAYPDVDYFDREDLVECMQDVYQETQRPFVIVIDEWDCIFREYPHDTAAQRKYLDFLRDWLKDKAYIGLAYMTGILPVKKYGTHSALNMFTEYSMENPRGLAPFVGFTEDEVKGLCEKYGMDFAECRAWYDEAGACHQAQVGPGGADGHPADQGKGVRGGARGLRGRGAARGRELRQEDAAARGGHRGMAAVRGRSGDFSSRAAETFSRLLEFLIQKV